MKLRVLRKDHTVIATVALLFGLGLIAINAIWPAAFGVFIAIGGVIGALMVLYEVRLTKRIAQAEFIRDLQSGFASDQNIVELWTKLLMKEDITARDRPRVSSYLTFFETLHLLLAKGALELPLTDDLFRNRFFTAIGNKGILDTALIREAGAFANIHELISNWHDHLLTQGIPIHPGYYSYVQALTEAKGFAVARLRAGDLPALVELQDQVLADLRGTPWLRANTDVMLKECLTDHITLGVRDGGELVAAAVLYDAGTTEESLNKYFTDDVAQLERSVNLKLVLVMPEHRGAGLGRTLVELLEQQATGLGKAEVLCTIHPKNMPSKSLFKTLGYRRKGTVMTTYGKRDVFTRPLPSLNTRWAR